MAVESNMLELGSPAADFSLKDVVSGKTVSKAAFDNKPLLLMFICAHCPFVIHVEKEIAALAEDYANKIGIVAISANDAEAYPADRPERLKEQALRLGFNFPYLYDESQEVAKAYKAACTPDFFLFDDGHKLVYRGRLDESRPGNGIPPTGKDLRAALDAVLEGRIIKEQYPSMGCNIKWRENS